MDLKAGDDPIGAHMSVLSYLCALHEGRSRANLWLGDQRSP